jgi:O-antigen/teichoic acid export membrane protein
MLLAIGGFSLMGAIAANVIASLVETAYAVSKQKINVVKLLGASSKMSFKVIIPVAILVIATRLFANMDLMLLRVLGTSIENVGIYGAAKNLAIIPGIIGLSYAPLLLSTLNRNLSSGKRENARITAGDAARSVFGLLPFAAIAAGSSEELAIMILGSEFAQSADFFTPLIIAAVFQTSFSISSAILMASKNVLSVAQLILSMVAFSFIGYFFLIPLHGSIAASWIMLLLSFLAAISGILLVKRHWQIIPPKMTVVRSLLLSMAAYFLSGTLQTNGATLLAELILLSMAVILSFLILGELSSDEIEQVKNIFSNSRWFSRKA